MSQLKMDLKTSLQTFRLPLHSEVYAEESDDGVKTIRGYAVKWSDTGDRYGDGSVLVKFAKGAFKKTLANAEHDTAFLQEHAGSALASTRNGSLQLAEDKTGLAYTAKLNTAISEASDAYHRVTDGISNGISVGITIDFNDVEVMDDDDGDGVGVIYQSVDNLFEISLVHSPVFKDTDAVARNALEFALKRGRATGTETDGQSLARLFEAKLNLLERVRVGGNHPA